MLMRGAITGLVAGIAAAFIVISLAGAIVATGFSDLIWMVLVLVAPATLAGVLIAWAGQRMEQNKLNGRLLALSVAFVSVTLAGAVAAPIVQILKFGWAYVNVSGYIEWGPLYGVLMIPISYPIARLLVKGIWSKSKA
jgi:hypothetical protein